MDSHFEAYIRQGEPEQRAKGHAWQTAIGLQEVDGLKPSQYLIETARQNIEGDITIAEAKVLIDSYYKAKPVKAVADRTEEADKVSARIAEILTEKAFSFSPAEYLAIHGRLFEGIYTFAGKTRDYNITKDEWVLNGETVYYASAESIRATLNHDFERERNFDYKGGSLLSTVRHIADFVSGIWQIHAFGEGNTRTTAVFAIKYLRTFGFDVANESFARHSWYFRNALVRANYNNLKRGVYATNEYLYRFFGNLLLGENNILKNREMRIEMGVKNGEQSVNGSKDGIKGEKDGISGVKDGINGGAKVEGDGISSVQQKILEWIRETPNITAKSLSEILKINVRNTEKNLRSLKNMGVIERIGARKNGYWQIVKR
ncbi:MAG: Fic family protein [Kiritimatiellaeota bacterium]|nr:Fic family protein [Kiritimatiellota bacterium]